MTNAGWWMTNGGWWMRNAAMKRANHVSRVPRTGWPLPLRWSRRKAGSEWRVASGTEGREMELIEKRQNKANCSGVYHCQIRTYDERARNPARALAAAETPEISTFSYRTPVQYR
jgi:hypothetical protein